MPKQEISTRAPLLPTIAHALSHTVYTNAKSPTLKMKLHRLLYYGVNDADGEMDDEREINEGSEIAPKNRSELMSTFLWHVMQKQLYQPDAARRLKGLTQGSESTNKPGEEDEELFHQTTEEPARRDINDFMFDDDNDDEEDMMEYESVEDDLDDFLFENSHSLKESITGIEEEDLFCGHDVIIEPNEDEEEDLFLGRNTAVELDEDDLLLQELDW
jgi:hypothetical protein